MPTFIGTSAADTITPASVSKGVTHDAKLPGTGADTLLGNDGNDTLDGGTGGDSVSGGAGDDLIRYEPTATQDHAIVDGGAGLDTVQVSAAGQSGAGWSFTVNSLSNGHSDIAGSRTGQTFDVDSANVENLQVIGDSQADHFVINNLNLSRVTQMVTVDLGASAKGGADGADDDLAFNTSAGANFVVATMVGGDLNLNADGQILRIHNLEARDHVSINAGAGDDTLDLGRVGTALSADGGAGNDTVVGGAGSDTLNGGAGDDSIVGGDGADLIINDFSAAQSGFDIVDGGAGLDTASFTATAAADNLAVQSDDLNRVFVLTNAQSQRLTNVESVTVKAGGGADAVVLRDLSDTALRTVTIDLSNSGQGDGANDLVEMHGSNAVADQVTVTTSANGATTGLVVSDTLKGVVEQTSILTLEAQDTFSYSLGAGNDVLTFAGPAGVERIFVSGGDGDDTIGGSAGSETFHGDAGNDSIQSGAGSDTITGDAGNDTLSSAGRLDSINAGDGDDTVISDFSGGVAGGETIDGGAGVDSATIVAGSGADSLALSASNGHILTSVDGAVVDMANVEAVTLRPGGGADTVLVNSPGATVDLSGATPGVADGASDIVTLAGTTSSETLILGVSTDGTFLRVLTEFPVGFFPRSDVVLNMDASDQVIVSAGDGADTFLLPAFPTVGHLVLDGGAGNDSAALGNGTGAGADSFTFSGNGFHISAAMNGATLADLVDVESISVDLSFGGGDGQVDTVTVNGSAADDFYFVTTSGSSYTLGQGLQSGPGATLTVTNVEASDRLVINGGDGGDQFDFTTVLGNVTVAGGEGHEIYIFNGNNGAGHIAIQDFHAHSVAGTPDVVMLSGIGANSLGALIASHHIFQSGADVVITDTGNQSVVTLQNVSLSSLGDSDFIFT